MKAIVKKEFHSFFASPAGYLIIGVFLLVNGLFLWVFATPYNIFDAGFADLSAFFSLAPWIFIFLIPAMTMKSFSEEKKTGTLELLFTKPLSIRQIISGKFMGAFLLGVMTLLPTVLYAVTITQLSIDTTGTDPGSMMASYMGLLFLMGAYAAIGIFASAISRHQIVAFMIAVFICFSVYYGFEGLATLSVFHTLDFSVAQLGMKAHFNSISRGVIDTRDVIYFITVTLFFLFLTHTYFKYENR